MAYYFEFDYSNGILRCTLEGDITDESLRECYEAARKYAAQIDPKVGIMDFSNVDSLNVSGKTVRDLAYHAPGMPKVRPRFLVTTSQFLYGMARMFQEYGSETRPEVHVVRTVDEAYTLLGVHDPHFEPLNGAVPIRKRPAPILVRRAEA